MPSKFPMLVPIGVLIMRADCQEEHLKCWRGLALHQARQGTLRSLHPNRGQGPPLLMPGPQGRSRLAARSARCPVYRPVMQMSVPTCSTQQTHRNPVRHHQRPPAASQAGAIDRVALAHSAPRPAPHRSPLFPLPLRPLLLAQVAPAPAPASAPRPACRRQRRPEAQLLKPSVRKGWSTL